MTVTDLFPQTTLQLTRSLYHCHTESLRNHNFTNWRNS